MTEEKTVPKFFTSRPLDKADNDRLWRRIKGSSIKQIGGDDGYQWCLIVNGKEICNGMTKTEAKWRRDRYIAKGEI